MNLTIRLNRLEYIIENLSSGATFSTPDLVEKTGVSKKVIQTDFKEFLLPLFADKTIYYDYSAKVYRARNNFLTKTLLCSKELSVIAILKMKSKDKYSDPELPEKTEAIFHKFEDILSNSFYQKSTVEKIDDFKSEIIQIKNAIDASNIIKCFYKNKIREVYPLKILNLEGYWYLIIYEPIDDKIKTFHLNTIKDIETLKETFIYNKNIVETFDKAINAYYKPLNKNIPVELFVEEKVARYFERKPLSLNQRIINTYDDGSCDIELTVTDFMEIIPVIQQYIPYVKVIEPKELKEELKRNLTQYMKDMNY